MRDFTSAAALGGSGVVISRQRRKDEAGEKEQTSREDGPVTLQEDTGGPRHLPWACPGVKTRTWTPGLWNVRLGLDIFLVQM